MEKITGAEQHVLEMQASKTKLSSLNNLSTWESPTQKQMSSVNKQKEKLNDGFACGIEKRNVIGLLSMVPLFVLIYWALPLSGKFAIVLKICLALLSVAVAGSALLLVWNVYTKSVYKKCQKMLESGDYNILRVKPDGYVEETCKEDGSPYRNLYFTHNGKHYMLPDERWAGSVQGNQIMLLQFKMKPNKCEYAAIVQ